MTTTSLHGATRQPTVVRGCGNTDMGFYYRYCTAKKWELSTQPNPQTQSCESAERDQMNSTEPDAPDVGVRPKTPLPGTRRCGLSLLEKGEEGKEGPKPTIALFPPPPLTRWGHDHPSRRRMVGEARQQWRQQYVGL